MDRIDALRLFTRLVERESFSAAARDLHIKQSTASKWLAELEGQLGVSLVERTTRSFHVTDAGRRFLERAREVLAVFDGIASEFSRRDVVPAGRVRINVPVVFGRLFVVPALVDFAAAYPRIDLEVTSSDRYVNLVEEGFDLAVRVGVPVDTSSKSHKLADSSRYLVATPGYLKAKGHPKTPRALRDHECLLHGEAAVGSLWRFSLGSQREKPIAVKGRIRTNNSEVALEMARRGLGVALLADWLVHRDVERGHLVRVLAGYAAPPAPICLLSPPGRYASPVARALRSHLTTAIARRLPTR